MGRNDCKIDRKIKFNLGCKSINFIRIALLEPRVMNL